MTGAAHNRGKSKQDYATPWEVVRAVERRFGTITWDLAASRGNAKAVQFYTEADDAFTMRWHRLGGLLWLNPPYANITPWARRCFEEWEAGARIALLVPAAVGSVWFAKWVYQKALVLPLRPRFSFDGVHVYPKDVMVCMYGETPGFEPWRWKGQDRG